MKKKSRFLLFVGFLLVFTYAYAEKKPIKIIELSPEVLLLQFELGKYNINCYNNFTFIDAANLSSECEEGEAMLPVYVFTVGIPPQGSSSFSISDSKDSKITLKYPVAPYPKFVKEKDEEISRAIYEIKPEAYKKSLLPKLVEVSEPFLWRNQRVVRFIIHPFHVKNNHLIITSQLKLKIDFLENGHIKRDFRDTNFENVFKNTIINFDIARYWSVKRADKESPDNPFSHAERWFKIPITRDGIYKITKSQLADAGIFVDDLNPEAIKIFNGNGLALSRDIGQKTPDLKEIPVFLSQSENNFPIYFYARDTDGNEMNGAYEQYFNPYAPANIYWLTYNYDSVYIKKGNGRIKPYFQAKNNGSSLTTYHYIEHFEEEKFRIMTNGLTWYWYNFSGSGSNSYSYKFNVSNLVDTIPQEIHMKFKSNSSLGSLQLFVNNTSIGSFATYSTLIIDGNFLSNGENTLDIVALPAASKTFCLDYFEVKYDKYLSMENHKVAFSLPQVNTLYNIEISKVNNNELQIFKVYDFDNVEKLEIEDSNFVNNTVSFIDSISNLDTKYYAVSFGGYLTPSEIIEDGIEDYYVYNENGQVVPPDSSCYLRDIKGLANTDMIIISPDEFYEESKELADFHCRIDSMTVLVAKLSDVYDEFSWGLPDVVAIRNFLKYALDNYGMKSDHKVAYAILVGDGSSDFRKYESVTGERNKIPPFIYGSSNDASDDYFVYFTTTSHPEMMIGRLPCQNLSQLEIVIDKIIDYVENPEYGFWRNRVILAADDLISSRTHGHHTETGHTGYAKTCAKNIEDNIELIKIYGVAYPFDEFQNKPEAREDIIKAINNGAAIFYYIGHGGYDLLGDEEYFRASRDISRLCNAERLPFFLASSCNVGHFDSNTFESMAEKMVLAKDKGSIASFAHAREGGYGTCSKVVSRLVNSANEKIRIGEAIIIAKGGTPKGNEKYVYFGDPVIHLAIPPLAGSLEIPDEQADSLQARQTADLKGTISDQLNQYDKIFAVVYDTDYDVSYPYEHQIPQTQEYEICYNDYIRKGMPIFKGPISCAQDSFSLRFITPDDIYGGSKGHILAYAVNTDKTKDILIHYNKQDDESNHNLIINGFSTASQDGLPTINIWLDRKEFQKGDYVSTEPTLFAEISDSNGINITNTPGHRILLTLDDEREENVTEKFVYNLNSYTDGTLEYQIKDIEPGNHRLKLEAFDNFNLPNSKEIDFKIKEPEHIAVHSVLNYPNPMKNFTDFTFYLDGDAVVDIEIFTISGKKIKTISDKICQTGYNQISWDGKDDDGDIPANGVYFYKILLNSRRTDKIYKLIISH